jgi:hypothetical protein
MANINEQKNQIAKIFKKLRLRIRKIEYLEKTQFFSVYMEHLSGFDIDDINKNGLLVVGIIPKSVFLIQVLVEFRNINIYIR